LDYRNSAKVGKKMNKEKRKKFIKELQAAKDEINSLFMLSTEYLEEADFEEVAWNLDGCAGRILDLLNENTPTIKGIKALSKVLDNDIQKKKSKTKTTKR